MGVRIHITYFDINPSQTEVIARLTDITGLRLDVNQVSENCITVQTDTSKVPIEVDWVNVRKGQEIKDILGEKFTYPFPDKNQCIRVFSESTKYDYLEITLIYLLKQFGGRTEHDFEFPNWAGKKWSDTSWLQKLVSKFST